jgi:hypothetical protein
MFEMQRKTKKELACDWCGDVIMPGERWYWRRWRERGSSAYQEASICEECAVFGLPYSHFWLDALERVGLA